MTLSGPPSASRVRMFQLMRYAAVGIATNLAGYLLYLAVTWSGVEPKMAMSVLYLAGATAGFVANRYWTFAHKGSVGMSAVRYAIAHALGYLLNLALLSIFADRMGYPHQWVQAAAVIVVALFLFAVFRIFVFSESQAVDRRGQ